MAPHYFRRYPILSMLSCGAPPAFTSCSPHLDFRCCSHFGLHLCRPDFHRPCSILQLLRLVWQSRPATRGMMVRPGAPGSSSTCLTFSPLAFRIRAAAASSILPLPMVCPKVYAVGLVYLLFRGRRGLEIWGHWSRPTAAEQIRNGRRGQCQGG